LSFQQFGARAVTVAFDAKQSPNFFLEKLFVKHFQPLGGGKMPLESVTIIVINNGQNT
jgi:hypothetical protein